MSKENCLAAWILALAQVSLAQVSLAQVAQESAGQSEAQAEPAAAPSARDLFNQGVAALGAGDLQAAKALLEQSLATQAHPTTAFNLAVALSELGETLAARDYLRALRAGRYGEPRAETVASSDAMLRSVTEKIATLDVQVTGVDHAEVEIDGVVRGVLSPSEPHLLIELDAGEHLVRASTRDGARSASERVRLDEGGARSVNLVIAELRVTAAPAPTDDDTVIVGPRESSRSVFRKPAFWIVTLAVIAGVATALALTLGGEDIIEDDIFGVTTTLRHP